MSDFQTEDLLEEYSSLPEYLHDTKDAARWTSQAVLRIRFKQCGREEIAWLFGVAKSCFAEALPSSADSGLIGTSLLDMGYLPRAAGCIIQGCKSVAFLNGRKCTLCKDLRDGIDQHAMVIVEGGTEEEVSVDEDKLRKTIMIARKNLEFAAAPETEGWPSLSLSPEVEQEQETQWAPSEMLGEVWHNPVGLPDHLHSADALIWLTCVVGRLVESKSCGKEEIGYLLDLPSSSDQQGFGGPGVPRSLLPEHEGSTLDCLGFIPQGTTCQVEGCNSKAHLNGKVGKLSAPCPEGQLYVKIDLGDGELQMHRKNVRLPKPPEAAPEAAQVTSEMQSTAPPELTGTTASAAGSTNAALTTTTGAPNDVGAAALSAEAKVGTPRKGSAAVPSNPEPNASGNGPWSWWPLNVFCCGPNVSDTSCCGNGMRTAPQTVIQDDDVSYGLQAGHVANAESHAPHNEIHPSFGSLKVADRPSNNLEMSLSDQLGTLVQLKLSGSLSETEFQAVKLRLLQQGGGPADAGLTEGLKQLYQLKTSGKVTDAEFGHAKQKLLQSRSQGKTVVNELADVLNLRAEGFLTDAELAIVKQKLLAP